MTRLGQLLVRADLVSENNLARALGVQNFAGGRIGTLLLERGSVSEDDLGKTLALQHGVEYVPWKLLADVAPIVIAALPAKFAIKHAAVPYDRSENAIKLALRDPADLRILDELFFVTGRKIIASVAPEVRIYQALEKYYGERRTPRYAILAEKLSRPARGSRAAAPPPPPQFFPEPERPSRPLPEPAEIWGDAHDTDLSAPPPITQSWKLPDQKGGWAGESSMRTPRLSAEIQPISWEEMPPSPSLWTQETAAGIGASSETPDAGEKAGEEAGEEKKKAAGRKEASQSAGISAVAAPPETAAPRPASAPELSLVSAPLAPLAPAFPGTAPPVGYPKVPTAADFPEVVAATDRDSIGRAVLSALSRFPAAALFAARPDAVAGWAASGAIDFEIVRRITIPWTDPSVFLNVRLSRSFYLGPLLNLPQHRDLAEALGGWPDEIVVQPVLMKEKPVAFLVALGHTEGITPLDLVYLRELGEAASKAFAAAIRLKKKEI